VPFSTPRAWAALSRALDLAAHAGSLDVAARRALAFGRLSAEDAAIFCAMAEEGLADVRPIEDYLADPSTLPGSDTARWFVIHRLRSLVRRGELPTTDPVQVEGFLAALPAEFRFALMVDLVDEWARLGASDSMFEALAEVTGL
jgi:hypothetical protein